MRRPLRVSIFALYREFSFARIFSDKIFLKFLIDNRNFVVKIIKYCNLNAVLIIFVFCAGFFTFYACLSSKSKFLFILVLCFQGIMAARPVVTVYNEKNEPSGTEVKLPAVFRAPIRPDVVSFVHDQLLRNKRQPYAVSTKAGVFIILFEFYLFRSSNLCRIMGYRSCRRPYSSCPWWWNSPLRSGCFR